MAERSIRPLIRRFLWRLVIAIPIGVAAAFEWLSPYFSRPAYIALGVGLAVLVLLAAAMAEAAWRRRQAKSR